VRGDLQSAGHRAPPPAFLSFFGHHGRRWRQADRPLRQTHQGLLPRQLAFQPLLDALQAG